MNKQPEPLRLADYLDALDFDGKSYMVDEAATKLRRLHEVNQMLLEACIEATSLFDNSPQSFEAIGTYEVLNKAIAKATGESK